jgi:hypothetical protein
LEISAEDQMCGHLAEEACPLFHPSFSEADMPLSASICRREPLA